MKKSIITYLIIASLSLIPAQTIHAGTYTVIPAAVSHSAAAGYETASSFEHRLLSLVNSERAKAGLAPPCSLPLSFCRSKYPGRRTGDFLLPYPSRWKRILHRHYGYRRRIFRKRRKCSTGLSHTGAGNGRLDEQPGTSEQYFKSRLYIHWTGLL